MIREMIVGATGSSGAIYAKRFLELACDFDLNIHLIASQPAMRIFALELGEPRFGPPSDPRSWLELNDEARARIRLYSPSDLGAGPASGTFRAEAMAIIPCSMKTLSAVAHGYADNLITRAADVMIKERRPLAIVPRETPLSAIHLENMLRLARLGVSIVAADPPFYHGPKTIVDLVDAVVHKTLAQLGLNHPKAFHWEGMEAKASDC